MYLESSEHILIWSLQRISRAAVSKLVVLHNLIDLSLGSWCMTCNFIPVLFFLQQTPNLQKITLYMCARHCRVKETGIRQDVDHSMWVYLYRYLFGCKNLKQIEIKLLRDYIKAHKFNDALLPKRKQIKNIEIIMSEHIWFYSFYVLLW